MLCTACESLPATYVNPVDFEQVCRDCFYKAILDMFGDETDEGDV